MHGQLPVLADTYQLELLFKDYRNPPAKIQRLVARGDLLSLKRGLFVRLDQTTDVRFRMYLANRLYGPSYISFQYALRWWGLIPESTANITSATWRKNRQKSYHYDFGSYFYRDVPVGAYPQAVVVDDSKTPAFLIASPEKALCDTLYTMSGIRSRKDLRILLFEDLRIDNETWQTLDFLALQKLAALYRTSTLSALGRYATDLVQESSDG
jgi:hypothetical protein